MTTGMIRFESDDVLVRRDTTEVDGFILYPESVAAAEAMALAWTTIAENMRKRAYLPAEKVGAGR